MMKKMVCTMMAMGMICAMGSNVFAASAQTSKEAAVEMETTTTQNRKFGVEDKDGKVLLDGFQVVKKEDGTFELVNKETGEKLFLTIQESEDTKDGTITSLTIKDIK